MARVQFGHGAERKDLPLAVVEGVIRRTSISPEEFGRSWNDTRRPLTGTSPVPESAGRKRQPQWAQKLWLTSRSLVRPQLAQRATGFVLARKSSGTEFIRETA